VTGTGAAPGFVAESVNDAFLAGCWQLNFHVTVHLVEINTAGSASFPVPDFLRNALGAPDVEAGLGAVEDDEPELHDPINIKTSANVIAEANIVDGRRHDIHFALFSTISELLFGRKRKVFMGPPLMFGFASVNNCPAWATQSTTSEREVTRSARPTLPRDIE
jgi:hypothetical protein